MSFGKSSNKSQQQSQSTSSSQLDPAVLSAVLGNYQNAQQTLGQSTYKPLTSADIQTYQNTYQEDVVNSTLAALQNQNQAQTSQNGVTAAASGDYNSTRAGVQNALTNQLYSQTAAQTLAQLENQNYNQASTTAQTENTAANNFPLALQAIINQTLGLGSSAQESSSQSTGSGSSSGSAVNLAYKGPGAS